MSDVDDGSIADEWSLLRRIYPGHIVPDGNTGSTRVSSAAFKDPEMSVDVEEMLTAAGRTWQFSLDGYPLYSLMRIIAAVPRALRQAVVHTPLPENDAHAEVRGVKRDRTARALRDAASWVLKR
jgi:hypothetical protein